MARKRRPADDPVEWLNRARSNLTRAKADIRVPHVYLEDLCFDAQQAAEKAIKAVLLKRGVRFPFHSRSWGPPGPCPQGRRIRS